MRKIKFRAWDKQKNEFYKPTHEAYKGNLFELLIAFSGSLNAHTMQGLVHESGSFPERFILMQYTGLKDKNGKEIYEGDILKTDSGNKQVIYNAPSFDLEDYDNGDYYEGQNPYCHSWNEFEIIGNIYENPELLEVKS